jgi:hypothetical protein
MLILGASTFIFIMLLPALLELQRPKDAGPRIIADDVHFAHFKTRSLLIANVEEEQRFDQILVKKIADVIAVLPNLEV